MKGGKMDMKSMKCSDLGDWECDFVATGETNDEIKENMHKHGMDAHKEMVENATDDMKEKIGARMDELLADHESEQGKAA